MNEPLGQNHCILLQKSRMELPYSLIVPPTVILTIVEVNDVLFFEARAPHDSKITVLPECFVNVTDI